MPMELCPTCGAHLAQEPKRLARQLERARAWRDMYLAAEQKALRWGHEIRAMQYAQLAADWNTIIRLSEAHAGV